MQGKGSASKGIRLAQQKAETGAGHSAVQVFGC